MTNVISPEIQWVLNYKAGTLNADGTCTLDAQGAANVLVGNTAPRLRDLVGCLNQEANNAAPHLRDLDGVCNQLAGTNGWAAVAALRKWAGLPVSP